MLEAWRNTSCYSGGFRASSLASQDVGIATLHPLLADKAYVLGKELSTSTILVRAARQSSILGASIRIFKPQKQPQVLLKKLVVGS